MNENGVLDRVRRRVADAAAEERAAEQARRDAQLNEFRGRFTASLGEYAGLLDELDAEFCWPRGAYSNRPSVVPDARDGVGPDSCAA